jgi:putative YhdH/YhfP family quinone oxidoreductase
MITGKFKSLIVKEENGKFFRSIQNNRVDELPEGEVLIHVHYSSLNYKDALSASGNKGVTRKYPHTPGIDAAGIVEESETDLFGKEDEVLVTGYDLGMNTPGGFGQYIRVPASWVVRLPQDLSLKESMIYGTAGFTAALAINKLQENGMEKNSGEILVTGATGGVGSFAAAILSKEGYKVTASTRKTDKSSYLKELGTVNIIDSGELLNISDKHLLNRRWKGAIDTVGGEILSSVIRSTDYRCSVAACGNVLSTELKISVYPFILRGVNLLGINSAETPMDLRLKIWEKISNEWKIPQLEKIYEECSLKELDNKIDLILKSKITGRILVNLNS